MAAFPVSRAKQIYRTRRASWGSALIGLVGLSLLAFALAPWSLQEKSIAVLHGLCAQQPGHSFWFGGERLPFDARMTGIYGGFLVSQCYLLARRRLRATGAPSIHVLVLLGLFVVALGMDGLNSLATDVGLPMLYRPTNGLRFATGALTGTTLAVVLWLLLFRVLWPESESSRSRSVIENRIDFCAVVGLSLAFGLVVASGLRVLYAPVVCWLVVAAVLVVFELNLALIQIARRRENSTKAIRDLAGPATAALLAAYVVLFAIGGARFLLEAVLPMPPMH